MTYIRKVNDAVKADLFLHWRNYIGKEVYILWIFYFQMGIELQNRVKLWNLLLDNR